MQIHRRNFLRHLILGIGVFLLNNCLGCNIRHTILFLYLEDYSTLQETKQILAN